MAVYMSIVHVLNSYHRMQADTTPWYYVYDVWVRGTVERSAHILSERRKGKEMQICNSPQDLFLIG